jgi:hypothetical protein
VPVNSRECVLLARQVDNRLALYNAGLNIQSFHLSLLVKLQQEQQLTLRAAYATLTDTLIQRLTRGLDSLEEVFGESAEINEFWNEAVLLLVRKDPGQGREWAIPLRH